MAVMLNEIANVFSCGDDEVTSAVPALGSAMGMGGLVVCWVGSVLRQAAQQVAAQRMWFLLAARWVAARRVAARRVAMQWLAAQPHR